MDPGDACKRRIFLRLVDFCDATFDKMKENSIDKAKQSNFTVPIFPLPNRRVSVYRWQKVGRSYEEET
jgi:hypothetical protein